jgi:hypothetical protein
MMIGVAACSSGGSGKHSATTTTARVETTTSAGRGLSRLGPCPKHDPRFAPASNANVAGLAQKLVPILASNVRVCVYAAKASAVLKPQYIERLEADTNALPKIQNALGNNCPPTRPPYVFVTFTNGSERVDVKEDGGCGFVTNGKLTVMGTNVWRQELAFAALHDGVLPK